MGGGMSSHVGGVWVVIEGVRKSPIKKKAVFKHLYFFFERCRNNVV